MACTLELAHLELTPTGNVRQVIGWLRAAGDVLAERYEIRSFLGRGGFAVTYLAEDLRLKGKSRAIKEIPRIFYDEFETELLARLRHPSIPDVIDHFETNEMKYLVLEFGGSRTLEGVRRDSAGGLVPWPELAIWIRQLVDVLTYLHRQDPPVVHRDLKPANVLLDDGGRIMLIDFGIAKQVKESSATRTIARSATEGFSPPEQQMGTGTDERSDVYALAATVYALVTGQIPPPAHERVAGRALPDPRKLVPSLPLSVATALTSAMELNLNRRPGSIAEFSDLLFRSDAGGATVVSSAELGERTQPISDFSATFAERPDRRSDGIPIHVAPPERSRCIRAGRVVMWACASGAVLGLAGLIAATSLMTRELSQDDSRWLATWQQKHTLNARLVTIQQQRKESQRVAELLSAAARQFADHHWTTPPGNNALDTYRSVLAIDPSQAEARAGIRRIKAEYLQLAEGAERLHDWEDAEHQYRNALAIEPGDEVAVAGIARIGQLRQAALLSNAQRSSIVDPRSEGARAPSVRSDPRTATPVQPRVYSVPIVTLVNDARRALAVYIDNSPRYLTLQPLQRSRGRLARGNHVIRVAAPIGLGALVLGTQFLTQGQVEILNDSTIHISDYSVRVDDESASEGGDNGEMRGRRYDGGRTYEFR